MAVLAVWAVGGAVGYGVGAAVGYASIGMSVGFAVGSFIGNMLFRPEQHFQGPRLSDLQTNASTDGSPIPTAHGTVRLKGNYIWMTDIKETEHVEEVGGKGFGSDATSSTFTYSLSAAVGFMDAPAGGIVGFRRVWMDGKLVYSIADGATPATFSANTAHGRIAFYLGTNDQAPDPTIEAYAGAGNVPGFVNHVYLVITDWQLKDFANHPPFIEAELVVDGATSYPHWLHSIADPTSIHTVDYRRLVQYSVEHVVTTGSSIWRWNLTGTAPQALFEFDSTLAGYLSYGGGDVSAIAIHEEDNHLILFNEQLGTFRFARLDLFTLAFIDSAQVAVTGFDLTGTLEAINTRDSWFYDSVRRELVTLGDGFNTSDRYVIRFVPRTGAVSTQVVADTAPIAWNKVPLRDGTGDLWFCDGSYLISAGVPAFATALPEITGIGPKAFIWPARGEIWIPRSPGHDTDGWMVYDIATGTFEDSINLFGGNTWTRDYTWGVEGKDGSAWFIDIDAGGNVTADMRDTAGAQLRFTDSDIQLSQLTMGIAYVPGVVIFLMESGKIGGFYEDALEPGTADLGDVVTAICARVGLTEIDVTELTGDAVRGFVIARPMTARNALEPLQMAYAFDGVESGQVVRFVKRGGASYRDVPAGHMGARPEGGSDEPPPRVRRSRVMETALPAQLTLRYMNQATNYNIAAEYARRLTTDAVNQIEVELPLVMTSQEAARVAENIMRQAWIERDQLDFPLPPSYRLADATDILTLADGTRARLTRTTYRPDGVFACEAVGDDLGMLDSYQTGSIDEPDETINIAAFGLTQGVVLDIALLRDSDGAQDVCRYFGACGEAADWPAAIHYQSRDGGASWAGVAANRTAAKIGVIVEGLMHQPHEFGVFDHASDLVVQLLQPDLTLSSPASDAAFYAGANAFAVSTDGALWEIAQAYTVTSLGSARYRLRDLLRGRKGTEYAAGPHRPGARVVFLDTGRIVHAPASLGDIGGETLWKAVTSGGSLTDEIARTLGFSAVAAKPLAPVHIGGAKQAGSGDIHISWVRRARKYGDWHPGGSAPLDEPVERYALEIWSEGYDTLYRTEEIEAATSFTYTAALQTTDFGGGQDYVAVRIYQISDRVGRGFAGEALVGDTPEPVTFSEALLTTNFSLTPGWGNLRVSRPTVGAADFAPCSRAFAGGNWYWEFTVDFASTIGDFHGGITEKTTFTTGDGIGTTDNRLWNTSGSFISHVSISGEDLDHAVHVSPTTFMFAWRAGTGEIWCGLNGRWTSGTDPIEGINPMATHTPGANWRPVVVTQVTGYALNVVAAFGRGNRYPVPEGYTLIR